MAVGDIGIEKLEKIIGQFGGRVIGYSRGYKIVDGISVYVEDVDDYINFREKIKDRMKNNI